MKSTFPPASRRGLPRVPFCTPAPSWSLPWLYVVVARGANLLHCIALYCIVLHCGRQVHLDYWFFQQDVRPVKVHAYGHASAGLNPPVLCWSHKNLIVFRFHTRRHPWCIPLPTVGLLEFCQRDCACMRRMDGEDEEGGLAGVSSPRDHPLAPLPPLTEIALGVERTRPSLSVVARSSF